MVSMKYHSLSKLIFEHKWGSHGLPAFIMYPYFEKDIETLQEQKYILPPNFLEKE
jgi:hypothetical protein